MAHGRRIGSGGMQNGAAGSVDRPYAGRVQRNDVLHARIGIVRREGHQPVPSPADPQHRHAELMGADDQLFDAWIESRYVSTAG